MTVHLAPPPASVAAMDRVDRCRGCLQTVAIADGETCCLQCLLLASIPVVAIRKPAARRQPQPMSLEAKLRQSIDLYRAPHGEEPL